MTRRCDNMNQKNIGIKFVSFLFTLTFILSFTGLTSVLSSGDDLIKSGVGIIVNPGDIASSSNRCESTITSCGKDGICFDLSSLIYCVNGKIVKTFCRYNGPINQTTSTDCKNINFGLGAKDEDGLDVPIDLTLYKPGTSTLVKKLYVNGSSDIQTFEETVDFDINYNSSKLLIKLKNLDLEKLDYI